MSARAREGAVLAGRFEVVRQIGAGGMGVVYEAIDRVHGSRVALKTIQAPTPEGLLRLKNEFRALQDLGHPNLVSLAELIEAEGLWFFTMELVAGIDLLAHVRPGGSLDEGRLRAALRGLAHGVQALHHAGLVHRDIKPSNLLVTPDARVVLLDLGLVTGVAHGQQSTELHVVGTVAYMAPEQTASLRVGPPADWYSVGVLLYEALTGRLPFIGAPLEILMNKQKFEPAPPRAIAPAVPPDLDALCTELLRFDPEARPKAREVMARLGAPDASDPAPSAPGSSTSFSSLGAHFVGRTIELEALGAAFAAARAGAAAAAIVEGESGVGKSLLVRRFVEGLPGEVVVVAGRCYERESVPFKAFDGVVDALSRHLARLEPEQASALLPRQAALLAQTFPVLRRIRAFAQTGERAAASAMDPQELRSRLLGAMRELFGRLADRQPVVVVIDDLQWADRDSLQMLAEVLRPPEAPALLLVATLRPIDGAAREALEGALPRGVRRIALGPLSVEDARALACRLLAGGAGPAAEAIVRESGGHPLFIDELARFAGLHRGGESPDAPLRLDDAIALRVAALSPDARMVVGLCAVAGAPLAQEVIARAAALEPVVFGRAVGLLRAGRLVRTGGAGARATIEPYHDRVREAVSDRLDGEVRQGHHRELALALEAADGDPEALSVHWRGAGDNVRAAANALRAAERAEATLAFDHAARLYRTALELQPNQPGALQVRLADSLANAGRGDQAADAYLVALQAAETGQALELRSKAAQQLILAGRFAHGLEETRAVFSMVGIRLPRGPRATLLGLLLRRMWFRLRGLRYRTTRLADVRASDVARLDLCWVFGYVVTGTDSLLGGLMTVRGLLLALRLGEPVRLARSLAIETAWAAAPGPAGERRVRKLLPLTRRLATEAGDLPAIGTTGFASGFAAFAMGRFRESAQTLAETEAFLRERCVGQHQSILAAHYWRVLSLFRLGELSEARRHASRFHTETESRGDLYGQMTTAIGYANLLRWLTSDDPQGGVDEYQRLMERWTWPTYDLQRLFGLLVECDTMLYRSSGAGAHSRLRVDEPQIRSTMLLSLIHWVRIDFFELRGRCALGAATEDPSRRTSLLRETERWARKLERDGCSWAKPWASMLRAGVARVRGHTDAERAHWNAAIASSEACELGLHAQVTRWRLGELVSGDEGRQLIAAADAWMRGQGIVRPDRWVAMLAPSARE